MNKTFPLLFLCVCCGTRSIAQIEDVRSINFQKADSIAALYPNHSLQNIWLLSQKLTKPLKSDVEKFRAIYKWTCDNIGNDYSLYLRNKRKREKTDNPVELSKWNSKFTKQVFKQLLNDHTTVCSGYAYLITEMAFSAGLDCVTIDGYGRTSQANIGGTGVPNHSWNAVRLNNKWYLCDPTWSSGAINTEESRFVKKFDPSYFLADPLLFIRNHYPLDSSMMFVNSKPGLNEFLNSPIIYSNIYKYNITTILPRTFEINTIKGNSVSFYFNKSFATVDKVELLVVKNTMVEHISSTLHEDLSGMHRIDQVFNSKGKYTVHVLLNGDYVFTYSVTVS